MRQNYFGFLELKHRLQTLSPNRIASTTQINNLIKFRVDVFFLMSLVLQLALAETLYNMLYIYCYAAIGSRVDMLDIPQHA